MNCSENRIVSREEEKAMTSPAELEIYSDYV